MKHLGYSELTKSLYILPSSAKKKKIDITDDVKEFISHTMGEIIYAPCSEDDPDLCGGFTSTDGQSMCYVKQVNPKP